MPVAPRPARPNGEAAPAPLCCLGALLLLLLGPAGCGGTEAPVEPVPPQLEAEPTPPAAEGPPSSFSLVVDEAVRRKRLLERLKEILRESEP